MGNMLTTTLSLGMVDGMQMQFDPLPDKLWEKTYNLFYIPKWSYH
jgi:hypothetical protein